MPTVQKADTISEIKLKLTGSSAVVLADYRGLTVKEMQDLRVKMRAAGAEVKIYKNTLTRIALRELDLPDMGAMLEGPTAFVFASGDPVAPAKVLMDFAKEHKALEAKGGFMDKQLIDAGSVKALASLPSREALVAQLLGTMLNPMGGLVRVLNGPVSAFARAVRAIADQKAAA